jgi:hypothetical protein
LGLKKELSDHQTIVHKANLVVHTRREFMQIQEREALDTAYKANGNLLKQLTSLEEQMASRGYKPTVPADYNDMPQLLGRATVEMVLKKPDGSPFNVEGVLTKEANLNMITIAPLLLLLDRIFMKKVTCPRESDQNLTGQNLNQTRNQRYYCYNLLH